MAYTQRIVFRSARWWWLTSVLVHASLLGAAVATKAEPSPHTTTTVGLELELMPSALTLPNIPEQAQNDGGVRVVTPIPQPRLGGVRSAQNIDSSERGEGGDARSLERGRLLSHRSESVNLSTDLQNTLSADQVQRLRTSRQRASWQNDRRTPNEGDHAWVSISHGELWFRVPQANVVPAMGAQTRAGLAAINGASRTVLLDPERGTTRPEQQPQTQGTVERVTAGTLQTHGSSARAGGVTAFMQPNVQHGHASTTSENTQARPQDDVDTAALATSMATSVLNASVHDGAENGAGVGGVGGGGHAGSGGGFGEGGQARAFGEGDGILSLSSPDQRYRRYFLQLRRRLGALTRDAFPEEDALALRQGTMIVELRVETNGTLHIERFSRHSGIAGYDRNVQHAVDGASAPAIPAEVSTTPLRVRYELTTLNPIVR